MKPGHVRYLLTNHLARWEVRTIHGRRYKYLVGRAPVIDEHGKPTGASFSDPDIVFAIDDGSGNLTAMPAGLAALRTYRSDHARALIRRRAKNRGRHRAKGRHR